MDSHDLIHFLFLYSSCYSQVTVVIEVIQNICGITFAHDYSRLMEWSLRKWQVAHGAESSLSEPCLSRLSDSKLAGEPSAGDNDI
jgi:hypothetical protein